MFDKDKEIGTAITDLYPLTAGTKDNPESRQFVLWSATVDKEKVDTEIGPATKTRLMVSDKKADTEADRIEATTLASAIADKAKLAEPDDFPAVVKLMSVPSKKYGGTALVLQFVKPYAVSSDPFEGLDAKQAEPAKR
jgi:hypothetical protein